MNATSTTRATITLGGDLEVGRVGYGAMQLTGPNRWGEYPDHYGRIALLRQAVEAGVTLIDTADVYGPHSNSGRAKDASFEDQIGTLAELRQEGLIHHIGLSNIMPIPGTTSITHLQENLDAQDVLLSPDDIRTINMISSDGRRQPTGRGTRPGSRPWARRR